MMVGREVSTTYRRRFCDQPGRAGSRGPRPPIGKRRARCQPGGSRWRDRGSGRSGGRRAHRARPRHFRRRPRRRRRGSAARRAVSGRTAVGRHGRRRPGARGPQAPGTCARAIGAGQPARGWPAGVVSEPLVSPGAGGSSRARSDRATAHQDAVTAPAGEVSERRQSAEGGDRQVAECGVADLDLRRADARHRCRRKGRAFPTHGDPGRRRCGRPDDQLRATRNRRRVRPSLRHA